MQKHSDYEQGVIGALILFDDVRLQFVPKLKTTDFEDEYARQIFEAIQENPKADKLSIMHALTAKAKEYALSSCQVAPLKINTKIILNDFIKNATQKWIFEQIQNLAFSPSVSINEVKEIIEQAETRAKVKTDNAKKYINSFFEKTETFATGFDKLDFLLGGGFVAGTIATVGARPTTGKTTLVINFLKNFLDYPCLFFSLEMTSRMIYDRIIADWLEIDYNTVHNHKLSKTDFENAKNVVLEMYQNIKVVDDEYCIDEIISSIYSAKPKLVVIDFVQIITTSKNYVDNRQRIDYISQQLKQCAKSTGCCIVVLSQVTRAGKDRPTMSDLKESGGLEQDSDYVLLLHRPYVNDKTSKEHSPNKTELLLDKNKFGDTGVINLDFNGKYQRFTVVKDMDEEVTRPINGNKNNNKDLF